MGELEALRGRVAAAARRLAEDKLVIGTAGNISARAGDSVAITPTGATLGSLTPEQVAIVDLEGRQTDGPLEPSSERCEERDVPLGRGCRQRDVAHSGLNPLSSSMAFSLASWASA